MVLRQEEMSPQQVSECRLMARAVAGEYKLKFHLLDMRDIVFHGNSEPMALYQGVTFSVGNKRFSALYAVRHGIFRSFFGKGDLPDDPLEAVRDVP